MTTADGTTTTTTTTIGRLAVWWCAVSLAASAAATGGDDGVYRLLVLHNNDMHARYDQVGEYGQECTDAAAAAGECYGGFARVKTAVDQERAAAAAGTADGTLFLNAGDMFQGTAFYTFFRWPTVVRMVDMLGIDVMSLGNHEFDNGVNDVASFIRNVSVPVVSSNLDLTKEPRLQHVQNLMKSKVLTVNGRKIGIIGYLTPETKLVSSIGDVKILPEIPAVMAEAKRLKNEGVDILIGLGHSGFQMDKQIAKHVEDIDLVIGGHTNTFLYNGVAPDQSIGPYPYIVEQPKTKRKVPVVQAYYITKYLGKLWLEFDQAGELIKSYGNPILLDSKIKQDPEISKVVEELKQIIDTNTSYVLGTTSVFLEGANQYCRTRECNIGNFITDSIVDYNIMMNMKSFDLDKYWTDAPISITQSGGIRNNADHKTRSGVITYGDLLAIMPFENRVGKLKTTGADIWAVFEYSVHRFNTSEPPGEFLQTSGLRVVIDLGQPVGKRVQSIYARCGFCGVPVYEKLDLNANYTLLVSDYLLYGGDGIEFKNNFGFENLNITEFEVVKQMIGYKSPIRPEVSQRIVLLNEDKLLQHVSSDQHVSTPLSNLILLLTVVVCLVNGL